MSPNGGHGIYGAEAAARHHFGKSAEDLTIDEAAWLAAILPSPRRYDPLRKTTFLTRRHERILKWIDRQSATPVPIADEEMH
ncbi:transglycosylase domain-containing protein [Candidatus Nitrospira nitrificans]|uniref:transglycosylase domain-containing protein n=1 Tax=Candidatus Nitrospira nitrificans TaxID=1742973 RepID=UPI0038B34ED7